ncbi:MAG: NAD(P)-binding domain-containing protein, partial [Chloroflexi bacterium]|nr:NAD(P)-binding domain-containing protein [Chloroflexota bacterium]
MTGPKVGFIGLGRMGLPMSRRLLAAGFDLTVHNRSQGKVQEIAQEGAHPAVSITEITRAADILLTCLPDIATS